MAHDDDEFDAAKFDRIREVLREEYTRRDDKLRPWIIGFSGGKDSTLLAQLVFEMLLEIPVSWRKRPVHVVSNDTMVESPIVQALVDRVLVKMRAAVEDGLHVPVTVVKTQPDHRQTFWVNLIGRGYPAPSRIFRWCTDRMKIRPTGKYIRDITSGAGGSVLLIGVRRDESKARAESIERHGAARLNPHGTVPGCDVFRPIVDVTTREVWAYLLQRRCIWGGTHRELATLYRNAMGGECPFVVDEDDAPSCGESSSARFGCWTCTVVEKDRSMEGFVVSGFEHLEPLLVYRDWLKELSADPTKRLGERRDGGHGLGPFTFEVREALLARLLETQREVGAPLISDQEVATIRSQWAEDRSTSVVRKARVFLDILQLEET